MAARRGRLAESRRQTAARSARVAPQQLNGRRATDRATMGDYAASESSAAFALDRSIHDRLRRRQREPGHIDGESGRCYSAVLGEAFPSARTIWSLERFVRNRLRTVRTISSGEKGFWMKATPGRSKSRRAISPSG